MNRTGKPWVPHVRETLAITVDAERAVSFPLVLRVPAWAEGATIKVGSLPERRLAPGTLHRIDREWRGRVDVALRYSLDERPATGAKTYVYGFEVGDHDRTRPLVLDPAFLIYCGYIGGSISDDCWGIAVDGAGNVYITGYTQSNESTFPVTGGPDVTFNGAGTTDAFVAKVNSSGTALVYCGYIGGSDSDFGYGIAVDASGNAYVTGCTGSTESTFPVTVGPDLTHC